MNRILYAAVYAAGAIAALSAPAFAQDNPAADTPAPDNAPGAETIIVTAGRDPDDPPVVAEARARLSETPGAVSVISQESYARRTALTLDDMLRDAPGVYAQRKWGGDIRISIRGSGIGNANHNRGLLIAQDGVPLNEADGFGDTHITDPLLTRYTEVYRGGNALRFGGAMLGGAINMVTANGRTANFENRARVEAGSFGTARVNLQMARQYGDWDMFVSGTTQRSDGYRPQNRTGMTFGSVNIGRTFGPDREVRLIVSGSEIDQEIPGTLTWAQFQANPRQASPTNAANNWQYDQEGVRASLRTTWRLNDATVLEGAVYAAWQNVDHPIPIYLATESRNYGAFGRLDWEGQLAGMRADAYLGAWYREGDTDSHTLVNVRGEPGALIGGSYQNARAADAFGEGRLFVTEQLAVVGGATWGVAERDYENAAIPTPAAAYTAAKDYDWLAPRLGLLWESLNGDQIFANVTKSVEPPNFGSLSPTGVGFAPVEAQEASTAEIGTRGRRGDVIWDVTYYHAWLDGELLQYQVAPGIPASTFNADETIHRGVEAALDWSFARGWRLRQTYTWSDFYFVDDVQYGDNELPIVPEHFYRAELRYQDDSGWFVAPSVEWSASDIWIDYSNTTQSPSYALLNVNAGWDFDNGLTLFVDARNLTDEAYISNVQAVALPTHAASASVYWPGDGFSVFAGLTASF
jgi:iron complex outermembrane receptor protein